MSGLQTELNLYIMKVNYVRNIQILLKIKILNYYN
jgi:hypothetical protein